MQQAIYTNAITAQTAPLNAAAIAKTTPARTASVVRHLARKWDLYGVVALLASCTAYGVFALASVV